MAEPTDPLDIEAAGLHAAFTAKNDIIIRDLTHVENAVLHALGTVGGVTPEDVVSDLVSNVIDIVREGCLQPGTTTKVDMLKAIRACLCAALRFNDATRRGMMRLTDPASTESLEDPVDI